MKLNAQIEKRPEILAMTSYATTDYGPGLKPVIRSLPADPAPIENICLGQAFVVKRSIIARAVIEI